MNKEDIIKKLFDIANQPYPDFNDFNNNDTTRGDDKEDSPAGDCPPGFEEIFGDILKQKK